MANHPSYFSISLQTKFQDQIESDAVVPVLGPERKGVLPPELESPCWLFPGQMDELQKCAFP
jgi:hypothetical protein